MMQNKHSVDRGLGIGPSQPPGVSLPARYHFLTNLPLIEVTRSEGRRHEYAPSIPRTYDAGRQYR